MLNFINHVIEILTVAPGHQILALPPLLLAALIGAGTGLMNNRAKQRQADSEREYQAATARYSPWTKMESHGVADPNMTADVAGGAVSGLAMGFANKGLGGATAPTTAQPEVQAMGPVASGSSYGNMLNKNAISGETGGLTDPSGAYNQPMPQQNKSYDMFGNEAPVAKANVINRPKFTFSSYGQFNRDGGA